MGVNRHTGLGDHLHSTGAGVSRHFCRISTMRGLPDVGALSCQIVQEATCAAQEQVSAGNSVRSPPCGGCLMWVHCCARL